MPKSSKNGGSKVEKLNGKTIEECKNKYEDYSNKLDSGSDYDLGLGKGLHFGCVQDVMNRALDKRLLELKMSNDAQFKREMAIQGEFNKASRSFFEKFTAKCEGRECVLLCDPRIELFTVRTNHANMIAEHSLELKKSQVSKSIKKLVANTFISFAKAFCQMPEDVWKEKPKEKDCINWLIEDLASPLKTYSRSESPEGDICAVL